MQLYCWTLGLDNLNNMSISCQNLHTTEPIRWFSNLILCNLNPN
uniref:Uncharacterized protein n=1 Tax=Arundo donax TaxID=35708 RepID=A0A0A9TDT8_ARUDO